jgi:hypothetical protein
MDKIDIEVGDFGYDDEEEEPQLVQNGSHAHKVEAAPIAPVLA